MKAYLNKIAAKALAEARPYHPRYGVPEDEWYILMSRFASGEIEVLATKASKTLPKTLSQYAVDAVWAKRSRQFESHDGHVIFVPDSWRQTKIQLGTPSVALSPLAFLLVAHRYITPEEAVAMGTNKRTVVPIPKKQSRYSPNKSFRGPPIIGNPCPEHFNCLNPAHLVINVPGRDLPIQAPLFLLGSKVNPKQDFSVEGVPTIVETFAPKKRGRKRAHAEIERRLPSDYSSRYSLHLWVESREGQIVEGRRRRMQGVELPIPDRWIVDPAMPHVTIEPLPPYMVVRLHHDERIQHLRMGSNWAKAPNSTPFRPQLPHSVFVEWGELQEKQKIHNVARGYAPSDYNLSCAAIWDTGGDPLPPW